MNIEPTSQDVAQVLHNYRLDYDTRGGVMKRAELKEVRAKMDFCHVLLHAEVEDVERLSAHRYAEEVLCDIDDEAFYRVTTEIRTRLEDEVAALQKELEDAHDALVAKMTSEVQA